MADTSTRLSRRWQRHWQAGFVLLIGLLITAALTVSSAIDYSSNEQKLTTLETRLTGSVLQTAQPQLSAELGRVVGLDAASANPVATFRSAMASQLAPRGSFTSASLVLVKDGEARELDHVGAASIVGVNTAQFNALYLRAARSPSLLTTRVVGGGLQRLGYLLSARGSAGVFVVGASQQLPTDRRVTVPAGSPDANLNFALYFGPKVTPSALIEADVNHLPLTGTTSKTTVPFGNNILTLVASPRSSLVGGWAQYLPWGILGAGILLSLGAAGLTDRLVRRRLTAESLAELNQNLYQQQRNVSEGLQRSLLPKRLPAVPGFELAAQYVPATQGTEIGGDWYSVAQIDDHRFAVVMGDVSGHGVAAAGTMAALRYTIATLAQLGFAPDEVLHRTGQEMDFGGDDHFATALVGIVDAGSGRLTIASAGHPPPLVIRAGRAEFVPLEPGPPLGTTGQPAAITHVAFPPGSTLVVYTDGLIERRGESLDAGFERLTSVARTSAPEPEELIAQLLTALTADGHEDDIALLAIRFSDPELAPQTTTLEAPSTGFEPAVPPSA